MREEIDAIGAQEMLMPVLQPAEPWRRTGRYEIDELFKLKDRKGADMVLAMTHEECVTTHVAQVVRSYRDLPLLLYHFQIKERDEPRPRAGVLRTREFVMKDAYSFDRDEEGLQASYARFVGGLRPDLRAQRPGVVQRRVRRRDDGRLRRARVHGAVRGRARTRSRSRPATPRTSRSRAPIRSRSSCPRRCPRRSRSTRPARRRSTTSRGCSACPRGALLKAFPVVVEGGHGQHGARGLVLVLVRGDHRVNEIKLTNALGAPWRPARDDEVGDRIGPAGFIGPVGANVPVLLDEAVGDGGYVVGANERDHHLRGVEPGRDFAFERVDVRKVEAGDSVGGQPITIEPAIEVGNIFQLGTRYSVPLGATYLDVDGSQRPIVMGSYGIGPARIVAAAVEQFADEKGIAWPRALAPWDVEVVALGKPGSEELAAAEGLYRELRAIGLEVLLDDRELGPGSKFADAELLGCPLRLTVGRRSLQEGRAEAQRRRGLQDIEGGVPLEGAAEAVAELWRTLP